MQNDDLHIYGCFHQGRCALKVACSLMIYETLLNPFDWPHAQPNQQKHVYNTYTNIGKPFHTTQNIFALKIMNFPASAMSHCLITLHWLNEDVLPTMHTLIKLGDYHCTVLHKHRSDHFGQIPGENLWENRCTCDGISTRLCRIHQHPSWTTGQETRFSTILRETSSEDQR